MGDECTCEQCRGLSERSLGAWLIGLLDAAGREPARPTHNGLLVVGEGGISIRLSPSEAGARAGRMASTAGTLL